MTAGMTAMQLGTVNIARGHGITAKNTVKCTYVYNGYKHA